VDEGILLNWKLQYFSYVSGLNNQKQEYIRFLLEVSDVEV